MSWFILRVALVASRIKNRVKQTAQTLGYFPNAAARALKTNRSYNIGVLFEEEAGRGLTHEYFSGVLNGLKIQAEKLGYDITFINTCFENRKMSYYEHCRYRNFEGVVIVCANFDDPDVIELMNSEIPVVTIDYVHHNCTAVTSNNIQGMEDLVKYIYSQGHRKIAYIHGQEGSSVTRDRLASFYRTIDELGLEIPDTYVRSADYLETKGSAKQTKELLNLEDPPTCIIYPDDTSLIGGRNVIIEMGLRIPRDISVAGYDGTMISQLLYPKLTTIRQNTEIIGSEAAIRLVGTIEKPRTTLVERVVIEGSLVPGQSVGAIQPKE
jgi:LacI family transcriptional regulator